MNQTSPELETLAAELEAERTTGRCRFQQESNGKKCCVAMTLECEYKRPKIIVIGTYKDDKNWSERACNLCIYKPQYGKKVK